MKLAVAFLAAAGAAAAVPVFPNDWSSTILQRVIINQGGVQNPDASVTCPAESPQCKVQTAFAAGINYNWVSGNQTAYYVGPQAAVSDYNTGKTYQIDSNTHICQSYCPIDVPLGTITVDPNATYQGQVTYNGVPDVDKWQWIVEIPVLKIKVQTSNFYALNSNTSNPTPVAEIDYLEFGAQVLGNQNATYMNFQAGKPDPSLFVVKNATSCPLDSQCASSGNDQNNDPFASNDQFLVEPAEDGSSLLREYAEAAFAAHLARLGHANPEMIVRMARA